MSRRGEIQLTPDEQRELIDSERVVVVASFGPRGWPHLMPLWYVPDGRELLAWTFAKSQKARNLERDPHATLQVEAGEDYGELRGAMLECDVALERDTERVATLGLDLMRRYSEGASDGDLEVGVRAQAAKRVGMRFTPTRVVSWDHRKLGGSY